jgi:serine/threonine protein kinase
VQGTSARLGAASVRRTDAPRDVPASGELAAGDVVAGRYLIDAVLGGGELGVTYRARDRVAACTVALKRFRNARTGGDATEFIEALREELRVARRIAHLNVVRLHDVGEDAGVPFVTVDYVEGISLAALLRAGGRLTDEAVLAVAKQLCRALVAAEEQGVVHGSLSPRQILLGYDGVLKVGDFTLARVERRARGSGRPAEDASRGTTLPQLAGATVGAPEYMAPEQLIGEEPSTRADLYAAGVVLYECVTGATPFRTDSPLAFLAQKLGDAEHSGGADALRASRPTRSSTALVLSDVIARMIAPDAEQRPRSAGTLLELLERAG